MKSVRFALALAALACFTMTASLAAACDGHEKEAAQLTSGDSKSGCASKAHLASGGGKSGCASKAQLASGTGCAKGQMTAGKKACCASKTDVNTMATIASTTDVKTCAFRAGEVALKGTVVCNHCNLKKSETCQSLFRTESGCLFTLAGDKATELGTQAKGGNKLVRIKGNVSETGELTVSQFRVLRTVDAVSAM